MFGRLTQQTLLELAEAWPDLKEMIAAYKVKRDDPIRKILEKAKENASTDASRASD